VIAAAQLRRSGIAGTIRSTPHRNQDFIRNRQ